MATTRSRDGTLPSRTYEAVIKGIRMRGPSGEVIKLPRGRPRKDGTRPRLLQYLPGPKPLPDDKSLADNAVSVYGVPQVFCRLRTPNYKDEMAKILGNDDEPYYGLFRDDKEASNTDRTCPTAEDRALCHQLMRTTDSSLRQAMRDMHSSDTRNFNIHQEPTKLTIHFGQKYTMDSWYRGAYPAEYTRRDYLAVCCYCLDYCMSDLSAERHSLKCTRRVPPGREIYRDGDLSMWEVDGLYSSLYCQNLCLLSKSFLSSKSLYRDVQPFYFYVLTKTDENGAEFIGYFSKQKLHSLFRPEQPTQCVSCIMALPYTQNRGYGQFLIEFSYLLTTQQQATGGPETPLSQLGEKAFKKYWERKVCCTIKEYLDAQKPFSLSSLSTDTGIHINHIVLTLEELGWLTKAGAKMPNPALKVDISQLDRVIKDWESRDPLRVKPELLMWVPLYE